MAAKENIFNNIYLWVSLVIFIICMAYFFWTTHKEKKHKKHAASEHIHTHGEHHTHHE